MVNDRNEPAQDLPQRERLNPPAAQGGKPLARFALKTLSDADGLEPRAQWLVFLVAAMLVVSKDPQVLIQPQFYAEGGYWFADAYNQGWLHSLIAPAHEYLVIFPKLVMGLNLLLPLQFAPLVQNLAGIFVQALPVPFLLSSRCCGWGRLRVRVLMAAVYLGLPNDWAINVFLTNAQWHLALLACLVVLAAPPGGLRMQVFDVVILILSGLTGPFSPALFPFALIIWWTRRSRWSEVVAAILAVTSALQFASLLVVGWQSHVHVKLGATPLLFAKILTGQVYVGALMGSNRFSNHANIFAIAVVMLIGTSVLVYSLMKGGLELRLFILYSTILFAAALKCPLHVGPGQETAWEMLNDACGARYWFFPVLALSWSLVWCATQQGPGFFKILAIISLVIMLRGAVHDWKGFHFPNLHFQQHVQQFASTPPGSEVTIPICPPEFGPIHLIKKRRSLVEQGH